MLELLDKSCYTPTLKSAHTQSNKFIQSHKNHQKSISTQSLVQQLKIETKVKKCFKHKLDKLSTEETEDYNRKIPSDEILTSRSQKDLFHNQNLYINKLLNQIESLKLQNQDLKAKVQSFQKGSYHLNLNEIKSFENQIISLKNLSEQQLYTKNQEISRMQQDLEFYKQENQKLRNVESLVEEIEEKCEQLVCENEQLKSNVKDYQETHAIILSQQTRVYSRFKHFYNQLNQLKALIKTTFVCDPPKIWKSADKMQSKNQFTELLSNLYEISINLSLIYDWMYPYLEKLLQNLNFKF